MSTFTFHFSFISTIVFQTSALFKRMEKEKDLNACCQMANIQPTRSRGGGTEGVKTIMSYRSLLDIKPCSSLKPRFGLQGEEELAGPPRSCPLRRAGPQALLRVRTVTPALCLSTKFLSASSLLWLTFWERVLW